MSGPAISSRTLAAASSTVIVRRLAHDRLVEQHDLSPGQPGLPARRRSCALLRFALYEHEEVRSVDEAAHDVVAVDALALARVALIGRY